MSVEAHFSYVPIQQNVLMVVGTISSCDWRRVAWGASQYSGIEGGD